MLDTKALIALGARAEIDRLTGQLGDVIQALPELRPYLQERLTALPWRSHRPPQLKRAEHAAALVHAAGNGTKPPAIPSPAPPPKRKAFSKKTRKRMADNMRRRWAAAKKAGASSLAPTPNPTKRAPKRAETPAS